MCGRNPVWARAFCASGARDKADLLEMTCDMNLNGRGHGIELPFLFPHGAMDRQNSFAVHQLVKSPRRELKIVTDREGGVNSAEV